MISILGLGLWTAQCMAVTLNGEEVHFQVLSFMADTLCAVKKAVHSHDFRKIDHLPLRERAVMLSIVYSCDQ